MSRVARARGYLQATASAAVAVAGAILPTLIDAKGDLITGTADNTPSRQAVGADGTTVIANSNDANGLRWANQTFSLIRSGCYSSTAFLATTNNNPSLNNTLASPFFVSRRTTFDTIATNHTATTGTAGTVIRLGIYASANDIPTTLILDAGTVPGDTAPAFKTIAISVTLDPGLYFLALNSGANVNFLSNVSGAACTVPNPTPGTNVSAYLHVGGNAALPSTFVASVTPGSNTPVMYLRAA